MARLDDLRKEHRRLGEEIDEEEQRVRGEKLRRVLRRWSQCEPVELAARVDVVMAKRSQRSPILGGVLESGAEAFLSLAEQVEQERGEGGEGK